MPLPLLPLALAGGGALANFLGGFFGGKKEAKDKKAGAQENDAAMRRAWDIKEQQRVARLKSLLSAAQARGLDVGTMDPSMLIPKPYPGPDSTKGISEPSFWNGLLGFAGNTALGAAQSMGSGGGSGAGSIVEPPGIAKSGADPLVDQLLAQGPQKSGLGLPGQNVAPFGGDQLDYEYPF